MKKLLTLLLTAALATAAATTAFADEDITIKPGTDGNPTPTSAPQTTVTYTVQPTYTVTIPAAVTFENLTSVVTNVKAENVRIKKGENLVIRVASTTKPEGQLNFVATTDEGDEQTYTIKKVSTSTGSGASGSQTGETTGGNTGLGNMFQGVTNLTQIDLSSLNIGTLTANEITQNSEVLKVNSETTVDALQALLLFTVGTNPVYAGEYKDTLTFTVSVETTGGNN